WIVQRARTDIWMCETVFEERLTIMARLVAESGCNMTGGFETWGMATAWVSRSETIWRAFIRSGPGWDVSITDARPGTDSEWNDCSQGRPARRSCSMGVVISCSTSSAERPSDSV